MASLLHAEAAIANTPALGTFPFIQCYRLLRFLSISVQEAFMTKTKATLLLLPLVLAWCHKIHGLLATLVTSLAILRIIDTASNDSNSR